MPETSPQEDDALGSGVPIGPASALSWVDRVGAPLLRFFTIVFLAFLIASATWNHFIRDSLGADEASESYQEYLSAPASEKREEYFLDVMRGSGLDYPESTMVSAVRAACAMFNDGYPVSSIAVTILGPESVVPGLDNRDLPRIIGNGVIAYCPEHISKLTRYRYELENSIVRHPELLHFTEGLMGG